MLTTIKLTGILAEKFIPEIKANISSLPQAISCLCANFPDFKGYILGADYVYSLVVKSDNWERNITMNNLEEAVLPVEGKTIIISPVVTGSGRQFYSYLTAGALIGLGFLVGGPIGASFIASGAAMGLQTLLFGYPGKPEDEERSTLFQSSGMITREGTPIPMVFGETMVKSQQVLSLNITTEYKRL